MSKTILALSFLLLNSVLCLAAEQPNPVRDTDGNELRSGTGYYILPALRGFGGGVTIGAPVNATERCPNTVVQDFSELSLGRSVDFTPVNPKKGVIRVSTDLNIRFDDSVTTCITSNVWKLDYAEELGKYVIEIDGVQGNPGRETLSNWFKIEESDTASLYKLVFCPTVCNTCRPVCGEVSIDIDEGGIRRLVLALDDTTGTPATRLFKFQKA